MFLLNSFKTIAKMPLKRVGGVDDCIVVDLRYWLFERPDPRLYMRVCGIVLSALL